MNPGSLGFTGKLSQSIFEKMSSTGKKIIPESRLNKLIAIHSLTPLLVSTVTIFLFFKFLLSRLSANNRNKKTSNSERDKDRGNTISVTFADLFPVYLIWRHISAIGLPKKCRFSKKVYHITGRDTMPSTENICWRHPSSIDCYGFSTVTIKPSALLPEIV